MRFNVKQKVKKHYGEIASKVDQGKSGSCCSCSSCGTGKGDFMDTSVLYKGEDLSALPKEAISVSLGCANPLAIAQLKQGETVLDLGSGGGIDVLMAAKHVGPGGKVYGLDMTDEMLELANKNKARMGVENVEFIKGYIENIPLPDETVDVILSNCVINLSEDKPRALSEAYRILKKGGRLAVADIVSLKPVPGRLRKHADMWCGCLAGTLSAGEYEAQLKAVGFSGISIEPVHVYTRSTIEEEFLSGSMECYGIKGKDLDELDGAFAGAFIRARKC
ncbi:MAG: arsenite methyltransferase [Bacillota bacterium]|nr:arsenite methyltransferase [Bacillota bacterium]